MFRIADHLRIFFLLWGALAFILSGCEKEIVSPPSVIPDGSVYASIEDGKYVIYRIDSLVRNDFTNKVDSFVYYLKETMYLNGTNHAASGTSLFRLERFYSSRPDSFANNIIWSGFRDINALVINEENIPVIKLNFPLSQGKTWNGNARNTRGSKIFSCVKLHESFLQNNMRFDSTAWVIQQADSNLVSLDYEMEIYSTRCGMTKRMHLKLQDTKVNIDPLIPLRIRANKGYTLTQTVIQFGKQ